VVEASGPTPPEKQPDKPIPEGIEAAATLPGSWNPNALSGGVGLLASTTG